MMRTSAVPYPYVSSIDPLFARIRSDPRWAPLMGRMKEEWERIEIPASPI